MLSVTHFESHPWGWMDHTTRRVHMIWETLIDPISSSTDKIYRLSTQRFECKVRWLSCSWECITWQHYLSTSLNHESRSLFCFTTWSQSLFAHLIGLRICRTTAQYRLNKQINHWNHTYKNIYEPVWYNPTIGRWQRSYTKARVLVFQLNNNTLRY